MNLAVLIIIIVIVGVIIMPLVGVNVIFLILGAIIAWAIIMRNMDLKKNINKVPEQALHIVNVEQGGVFELRNVGDNYENMTLTVLAKHLYQEGDFSWFELECDKGSDEKVWVEVEDDDDTAVTVVLKKMKLQETGVTVQQLYHFDDEESGSINFNGQTFNYEDSGDALFYRFCDDTRVEKLYYWDFANKSHFLSFEKWGESEYEAFFSQRILPHQISVLRNNQG